MTWRVLMIIVSGCGLLLHAGGCAATEVLIEKLTADVQHAIQRAEQLSADGKYAEAIRLLWNAMYTEHRLSKLVDADDARAFSFTAEEAMERVQHSLMQNDQSPLMQRFRDPDVPLAEKLADIDHLREVVSQSRQHEDSVVLGGTSYRGPLIEILTSQKLNEGEKFDLLWWLQTMIQRDYVSPTQQEQIREEITRLRNEADRQFRAGRYVEAFVLMTEAIEKESKVAFRIDPVIDGMDTSQQEQQMLEAFLHTDASGLMQMFRDPQITLRAKQRVLAALRELSPVAPGADIRFFFEGQEYDGTLVQILVSSKVKARMKATILGKLERMIATREYSPLR